MKPSPFSVETSWFLIICFINASIASFLSLNGFPEHLIFWSIQSLLFSLTACIGHFTFLFLALSFPFWVLGLFITDKRVSNSLILICNISLLMLIYIDARIFELYKFHLNSVVIELISGGALQEVFAFDFLRWSFFILFAAIMIILEVSVGIFLLRYLNRSSYKSIFAILILLTFLTSATVSQTIYIFSDARGDTTITDLKRYIPWPQTITAKSRLKDWGLTVRENNNKKIGSFTKELNYPKQALACTAEAPYNLVFIVVDALRFDMLDKEVMPYSWEMAQAAHSYNEHYSLSNSTRFGLFSLIYGLTGNYWNSIANNQQESVFINTLATHGYQFNIASSSPLFGPEFNRTVFSDVSDQLKLAPSKEPAHKKDAHITNDLKEFLDNRNQSEAFFSFVFYDSPGAYSYPDKFKEKFKPSWEKINYLELDNDFDASKFLNRYKNSVAYTDSLLGEIFKTIKSKALLENTIIVLTSTHGQEFNETGKNFWGHNGNFSVYQTKVPLFIYWPENHPLHGQQQFKNQTASIDLAPTLMNHMFSCNNAVSDYSLGYDLYASQNNYARPLLFESWSQRAIMGLDYIMVSYDAGGNEYFDRNYQRKENFSAPQEDLSAIFKQMSAFNK